MVWMMTTLQRGLVGSGSKTIAALMTGKSGKNSKNKKGGVVAAEVSPIYEPFQVRSNTMSIL